MPDNRIDETPRRADPNGAAQDAQNAANQEQVRRDHDELQRQASRVDASVPPAIRDRTVGEIVRDAEARADREGRG